MQIAGTNAALTRTRIFALILVSSEDLRDTGRSTPSRIAIFAITLFFASLLFGTRASAPQRTILKRAFTCGFIAVAFWVGGDHDPNTWTSVGFAIFVMLTAIGAVALFRRGTGQDTQRFCA